MALIDGLMEGLRLPPDMTVCEWAEQNVILGNENAEPGPYRVYRTPYARGMMDVLLDPDVEIVAYHTSAQVAKTMSMLIGIGYHIHHDPCAMLMVLPDNGIAETFSKAKLTPYLNSTQVLRDRIGGLDGSRQNSSTMYRKEFPGGYLALVGAKTPAALAMQSVRIVWADEIDRFPMSAGREGDPLWLAFVRARTYVGRRKLVVSSTPTIKSQSNIDNYYEASDKRLFLVPLPCGCDMQHLEWGNVRWEPGRPESAEYACRYCGELHSDPALKLAIRDPRAKWVATAPFTGTAGFHIWQIYSPWSSMQEIVSTYERSKDNPLTYEGWVNTVLGESWDQDENNRTSPDLLYEGRIEFPGDKIPRGAAVVCAGVDVQGDRLELLVAAFGPKHSVWLLNHQVFFGDVTGDDVWTRLEDALKRRYAHETHPLVSRPIEGVAIDSGAYTQRVYDFVVRAHRQSRPWFAVKGQPGEQRLTWEASKMRLKEGTRLYNVGVDTMKTEIYARLASESASENRIYIRNAECFTKEFCEQLLAERVRIVPTQKGFLKREWHKIRPRNEALDLLVYAEAVHRHLNIDHVGRLRRLSETRPPSTAGLAKLFV